MKLLLPFAFVLLLAGCRQSEIKQYQQLVKNEVASKKKVNEIFFGISLGMPNKDFYVHCWNMNKKGVFQDGSGNTSVLYQLNHNELKHPADLYFYPEFGNGKIKSMWAKFQYAGWAPWNKQLGSDSLLPDVVNLYKKWYPGGNDFITISDPKRGTMYAKVDGNRRILIGLYDDVQVKVDYTDLLVEAPGKLSN
jgi:hypothetical protein